MLINVVMSGQPNSPLPPGRLETDPVQSVQTCCVVRSHWELKKSSLSWVKTGTSYSCTMGGSGRCSITFRWMVFDSSGQGRGSTQVPQKPLIPPELVTISPSTPPCHADEGVCSP